MEDENKNSAINMQILTPTGFQPFDGVKRYWHNESLEFLFSDGTRIRTSFKHKFIVNNKVKYADELFEGFVLTDSKRIDRINIIKNGEYFYDPVNVADGAIFYHDYGLISHNTFLGTGNTLIDPETLIDLRAKNPIETRGQMKVYEKPKKNHEYVAMVDVSHGGGGDYSVINIIDVSDNPFKQVAVYRNNRIPPLLFPTEIAKWAKAYNEAMVIVESNDQGTIVANGLYYDLEYPNMFVESAVKANGIGLNMTKKTKLVGCSGLKQILETSKLEIVDADTIDELSTFEVRGNSFAASDGNHDDIVMTLVSFGHFISTQFFSDMTDINLREFLYKKRMREIEEDIVPFGHIDNGVSDIDEVAQVPRSGGWTIVEERSFF